MTSYRDLTILPDFLPEPLDDGASSHLKEMQLPSISLPSTAGGTVDLSARTGTTVLYCYPRTGRPGESSQPDWDAIPGARGCTPQSCAFRDHFSELQRLGADIIGLSTQTTEYQREAVERLHLPFALLSDAALSFTTALQLPTFEVAGMVLLKRLTLVLHYGTIRHVFYPVFPPDKNAENVIAWLTRNPVVTP